MEVSYKIHDEHVSGWTCALPRYANWIFRMPRPESRYSIGHGKFCRSVQLELALLIQALCCAIAKLLALCRT